MFFSPIAVERIFDIQFQIITCVPLNMPFTLRTYPIRERSPKHTHVTEIKPQIKTI